MRLRAQASFLSLVFLFMGTADPARSDEQEDPTRQLGNLVYYPHRGQFLLTPQFSTALQDSGQTMNNTGMQMRSQGTSYYHLSAGLTYGVFDGLRFGVSETELFDQKTRSTDENTGITSINDSHGFSDPTFTVAERWADSAEAGFYADLVLSATPPFGHSLSAGNGQTGNNLANGWSSGLSLPFYWHWRTNEVELEGQLSRNFGGSSSGETPGNSSLTSSYWSGSASLNDRIHLNDAWYVQPGLTVYFPYTYHTHSQAVSASDTLHQVDFYASPDLNIGYLAATGCLISATINYVSRQNETFPAKGTSSELQSLQTTASLRAAIQF